MIELGKRLVTQLDLDGDLLAQWMAHDISARIDAIERASPEASISARDECAKSILTLWEHRNVLPSHLRVFKDIDPLIRTLTSLDVDHGDDYRYFRPILREAALEQTDSEMNKWLELAFGLDYSARILIQYALRSAGESAASKARPWVEAAMKAGVDPLAERQTVDYLLERWCSIKDDDEDEEKAILQEALRDKISKLENFAQLASAIATQLRDQLD
ncbi:hypothetical protein BJP27_18100 [Pseudomonas oryzihabitans]|nr:hypothetical protein BJP27_18100 [Pseudomonas psychrotolerans]